MIILSLLKKRLCHWSNTTRKIHYFMILCGSRLNPMSMQIIGSISTTQWIVWRQAGRIMSRWWPMLLGPLFHPAQNLRLASHWIRAGVFFSAPTVITRRSSAEWPLFMWLQCPIHIASTALGWWRRLSLQSSKEHEVVSTLLMVAKALRRAPRTSFTLFMIDLCCVLWRLECMHPWIGIGHWSLDMRSASAQIIDAGGSCGLVRVPLHYLNLWHATLGVKKTTVHLFHTSSDCSYSRYDIKCWMCVSQLLPYWFGKCCLTWVTFCMTVPVMCLSAQARSMQIFHQHTLFHCTGDDFTIHANRYTKFSYVKQITDGIMKDIVYICWTWSWNTDINLHAASKLYVSGL